MFPLKACNERIHRRHERFLGGILSDYESLFYDIVLILNEKTIHQICIKVLLTEIYKYLSDLSPELMSEVFYLRQNHCSLRSLNVLATDNPRKEFMLNSTSYLANQIWQTLPPEVKGCSSLQLFRNKIKAWRCDRC